MLVGVLWFLKKQETHICYEWIGIKFTELYFHSLQSLSKHEVLEFWKTNDSNCNMPIIIDGDLILLIL